MKKLLIFASILSAAALQAVKEVGSLIELKSIISNKKYVVMDYYSPSCPPCMQTMPHFEKAAQECSGVVFIKVNNNQDIGNAYGIRSLPTIIFFKDGKEVKRMTGAQNQGSLSQAVRSMKQ